MSCRSSRSVIRFLRWGSAIGRRLTHAATTVSTRSASLVVWRVPLSAEREPPLLKVVVPSRRHRLVLVLERRWGLHVVREQPTRWWLNVSVVVCVLVLELPPPPRLHDRRRRVRWPV